MPNTTYFNNIVQPWSMKAGAAVTKNHLLKLDSSGDAVHSTAITDVVIGVALNTAAAGETVAIQSYGPAKLIASGTVTIGDQLMSVGSGTGECATAAGATAQSIGVALQTVATTQVFTGFINCPGLKGPANS